MKFAVNRLDFIKALEPAVRRPPAKKWQYSEMFCLLQNRAR